jgi:hypothetical protein
MTSKVILVFIVILAAVAGYVWGVQEAAVATAVDLCAPLQRLQVKADHLQKSTVAYLAVSEESLALVQQVNTSYALAAAGVGRSHPREYEAAPPDAQPASPPPN